MYSPGSIKLCVDLKENPGAFSVIDQAFRIRDDIYWRDYDRLESITDSRAVFQFKFPELVQGIFGAYGVDNFISWFESQIESKQPQAESLLLKLKNISKAPMMIPAPLYNKWSNHTPQALYLRNIPDGLFLVSQISRCVNYSPRLMSEINDMKPLKTKLVGEVESKFKRAIKEPGMRTFERHVTNAFPEVIILPFDVSKFSESNDDPNEYALIAKDEGYDKYINWAKQRHEFQNKEWFPTYQRSI